MRVENIFAANFTCRKMPELLGRNHHDWQSSKKFFIEKEKSACGWIRANIILYYNFLIECIRNPFPFPCDGKDKELKQPKLTDFRVTLSTPVLIFQKLIWKMVGQISSHPFFKLQRAISYMFMIIASNLLFESLIISHDDVSYITKWTYKLRMNALNLS